LTAPEVSPRSVGGPAVGPGCIACGEPVDEDAGCCSFQCALHIERELKRNVGLLVHLRRRGAAAEERLRLAERNGELASALLRWRP
jgi:predicted nucleic acid-binding Zn ribbon protein